MDIAKSITTDDFILLGKDMIQRGFIVKHIEVYLDRETDDTGHLVFRATKDGYSRLCSQWEIYNGSGWTRVTSVSINDAEQLIYVASKYCTPS